MYKHADCLASVAVCLLYWHRLYQPSVWGHHRWRAGPGSCHSGGWQTPLQTHIVGNICPSVPLADPEVMQFRADANRETSKHQHKLRWTAIIKKTAMWYTNAAVPATFEGAVFHPLLDPGFLHQVDCSLSENQLPVPGPEAISVVLHHRGGVLQTEQWNTTGRERQVKRSNDSR